MRISLNSERFKALTLLPFGYTLATRNETPRDFFYLVLSSWLPAVWLVFRLGGLGPEAAALTFAAGYLCFISIYEIGYFINDTWDAARSETARRRIRFTHGRAYAAGFVAIRLATWAGLGHLQGWIADPVWLAGFAALAVTLAAYNLTGRSGFRPAAFFQLTCLRFALPVVGAVPPDRMLVLFYAAIVFYTFFRFLSFLEGKGLLTMPDRGLPVFGLVQTAMLAPGALFLAFASGEPVIAEILAYLACVYGAYALVARA